MQNPDFLAILHSYNLMQNATSVNSKTYMVKKVTFGIFWPHEEFYIGLLEPATVRQPISL